MAAVSARRMRGPRVTAVKPAAARRATSAGSHPPAGPTRRVRASGRGMRPRGGWPSSRSSRTSARPGGRGGQELPPASTVGATIGHGGAAALLGGAARHLLPAVLPRALQGGAGGGVGADGDHRADLGHAELGRLLDDQLHAVALQGRQREDRRGSGDSGRGAAGAGDAAAHAPAG